MLRGIHAGRSKCTYRRGRADTFARVKFASDTVREKLDDLLAEASGTLAAVNEDESHSVAKRLRKAKGAAPLNLTSGGFAFLCFAMSRLP